MVGSMAGLGLAVIGAAIATVLPCIGSAIGVGLVGQAASPVVEEDPEKFGKLLILEALPGTQGVYGFLAAALMLIQLGLLTGAPKMIDEATGGAFLLASLPVALAGLVSAYIQAKVAVAGVSIIDKKPDEMGKAITMAAMVETYAILGLLITILMVLNIPISA